MSKLYACVVMVILMSLAACGGTRYTWVPQGTHVYVDPEYEGTGIPDPDSEL
jgi:hypothetical protein